ncbi:MAG: Stf0 sulfotransferase family protein [Silicimonas sp.]|nr:Stf0 sulfotransferase family protein [Silicimonas sp.]NNL35307.1 hypothetical protein [Silicimonas sp.]
MNEHIFEHDGDQRPNFERLMKRPAPERCYAIHFTPRSGSSWLTDAAERSGVLGSPRECFNPNFMPEMVRALGAFDLEEYIEVLGRRFQAAGTWGFEITHFQLERIFETDAAFHAHFGDARHIWLIREDIVAQAVSLQKMHETGVSHSVSMSADDRQSAEERFAFDAEAIGTWLLHIRRLETITEKYFNAFGIAPLRLSYERLMSHTPGDVIGAISRFVGAGEVDNADVTSTHEKVGTPRNLEFADRFRKENRAFCSYVAEDRQPLLSGLESDLTRVARP